MEGRDFVVPDNVKFVAKEVFMHRILLKPDIWATGSTVKEVVETVVRNVPVPKG